MEGKSRRLRTYGGGVGHSKRHITFHFPISLGVLSALSALYLAHRSACKAAIGVVEAGSCFRLIACDGPALGTLDRPHMERGDSPSLVRCHRSEIHNEKDTWLSPRVNSLELGEKVVAQARRQRGNDGFPNRKRRSIKRAPPRRGGRCADAVPASPTGSPSDDRSVGDRRNHRCEPRHCT